MSRNHLSTAIVCNRLSSNSLFLSSIFVSVSASLLLSLAQRLPVSSLASCSFMLKRRNHEHAWYGCVKWVDFTAQRMESCITARHNLSLLKIFRMSQGRINCHIFSPFLVLFAWFRHIAFAYHRVVQPFAAVGHMQWL